MKNNHGHILVVDDNRMNRLKLSRSLEKQGHTVALAENGRQALDMMQTQAFDLALLDIVMPEMDGYQALERLKRDSTLRDIPVIVISAIDEMESIVKCVEMGAEDYLSKPFDPVLLRARIGASLGKKRLRDKLASLNHVGQELTATLDLPRVVERLLRALTGIVGAQGAVVWLRDQEGEGELVCQGALCQGQKHSCTDLRLRRGQGIAGWVAESGQSLILHHAPDDARFFPGVDQRTGLCTTSLLAAPLWTRDTVSGVLQVMNKLEGGFDEDDGVLVETLAASAAIALDNARLVEALRQRTAELEARNEELDAFAHTVAHDLKNPLTVVSGFASVLVRSGSRMQREKLQERLRVIAQHGSKMNNIIDELLLLSSVRKMDEIDLHTLPMAALVSQATQRLAYLIEEYQAEVLTPEAWPAALGYGPWIEEVWVNYLSNAIKYGGQPPRIELGFDSGQWSVGSGQSTLTTDHQPLTTTIRFWIRDNGPGLTKEEQARLFTPFTRLNQVRAKGHGLGLSIVRRIVEKLNGQVGVESVIGEGSTFSFTLPGAPAKDCA
jgi:signal transduction histidine kinase/DNA-binding NarL/FixJ family response regulator